MNDTTQTLVRSVLKVGGGFIVAKGITDQSTMEIASAGVVAIFAIVWGVFHRTK